MKHHKTTLPADATQALQLLLEMIQICTRNMPVTNQLWAALLDQAGMGLLARQSLVGRKNDNEAGGEIIQRTKRDMCMLWCPLDLPYYARDDEDTEVTLTHLLQQYCSKQPYTKQNKKKKKKNYYDFDKQPYDFEVRIPTFGNGSASDAPVDDNKWKTTRSLQLTSLTAFLFLGIQRRKPLDKTQDNDECNHEHEKEETNFNHAELSIPLTIDVSKLCDSSAIPKKKSKMYQLVGGILYDEGDYVPVLRDDGRAALTTKGGEEKEDSDEEEDDEAWKLLETEEVIPMSETDVLEFLKGEGAQGDAPCGTMAIYRRVDPACHDEMNQLLSDIIISQVSGTLNSTADFYIEEEIIEDDDDDADDDDDDGDDNDENDEHSGRESPPRRRGSHTVAHGMPSTLLTLLGLIILLMEGCQGLQALPEREGIDDGSSLSFGSYIRQQQHQHLRGRPLRSSFLRSNANQLAIQIPIDEDVTSPPYRIQEQMGTSDDVQHDNSTTIPPTTVHVEDYGVKEDAGLPTRQTGNPQVNQEVPVDVQMRLSVEEGMDYGQLMINVEQFLEQYLEVQYQRLIDKQNNDFALTDSILRLQQVDLTVLLVGFPSRRRGLSLKLGRSLQEATHMATMNVEGRVEYSVEVDGGSPFPEDVEQEWNSALNDVMSQPRLDEAITQGGVDGVLRVDQVLLLAQDEQPQDAPTFTSNDSGTTPWQDGQPDQDSSELTRPSTLSIIFGFLLTGIAILGLIGYCCIFYRKRKKRLRKQQQIKDTITFPPRNVSGLPSSKRNSTGSASTSNVASSQRSSPSAQLAQVTSPMILTPVEEAFSEDTSYKGIESSIASEDAPDAFAEELQRAASLDQQAWDQFQRRKQALDLDQEVKLSGPKGKESKGAVPSPLLGRPSLSSEDELFNQRDAVETDIEGRPSFAQSFPYGDEGAQIGDGGNDDDWIENPMTPRSSRYQVPGQQWEPYNSALPPSPTPMEEKKDESSPTQFFAKELQNIEMDLARYGKPEKGSQGVIMENPSEDDLSNIDAVSEVEELSRYVRRYEQRRQRRHKREMEVHDRFGVGGASTSGQSVSIGMDGQIHDRYQNTSYNESTTPSSVSTMSSLPLPPESGARRDLTSYADSYLNERKHPNIGSLSFVSDDEDSQNSEDPTQETSIRSQRLGISPFSASQTDEDYYLSYSKEDKSTATVSTRAATVPSSPDDYRYSVGYGYDGASSSNGKIAESNTSSKSSTMSASRLSNLRRNNAIIDSSNSDINVPSNTSSYALGTRTSRSLGQTKAHTAAPANNKSTAKTIPVQNKSKKSSNTTFDRLRGMFEQKTNEQPAPIYPPGEHWQFEGHKKT
jgi:hypothetical protein